MNALERKLDADNLFLFFMPLSLPPKSHQLPKTRHRYELFHFTTSMAHAGSPVL